MKKPTTLDFAFHQHHLAHLQAGMRIDPGHTGENQPVRLARLDDLEGGIGRGGNAHAADMRADPGTPEVTGFGRRGKQDFDLHAGYTQVRRQVTLGLLHADAAAGGIALHLVAADLAHPEVTAVGMVKIKARYGGSRSMA